MDARSKNHYYNAVVFSFIPSPDTTYDSSCRLEEKPDFFIKGKYIFRKWTPFEQRRFWFLSWHFGAGPAVLRYEDKNFVHNVAIK